MIILAGMIGVGKTTYSARLAQELGTEAFFEPVDDNPILDKYYENPDKYGFALQVYFLNQRFKSVKAAYAQDNNILDRSIYEDALFTYINALQGKISQEEYGVYQGLLETFVHEITHFPKEQPDLLVYLDGSFEHILSNIKKRGRSFEQPTPCNGLEDYYRLLHSHYQKWYQDYDRCPKMIIHTDDLDIHQDQDWDTVYQMISQKMKDIRKEA
ncbi:deoxyadenosine/deoxycytidine kinase [Streptococcus gallinaceus]|uniref:deoxynucleoside kinase n=1 Tax=Streptococcus gallinaceus TaxID=165758 RepID=UPI00209F2507|nr:deoxynucleoside kinase [Streptococcus gallinaceus]MCP1638515.1 deoxyadenosine/deoxycytidine kinase [Streptococcus gallinaceus]MCP1769398.1 deoxyadenosine/deoxycytidine kinase [Streptococcus gallinaceus]